MASIQYRKYRGGGERWRVMWREHGQQEEIAFFTAKDADKFRGLVDFYGGWPPPNIWNRAHACLVEQSPSSAPTFREYATKIITNRVRISRGTAQDYNSQLGRHVYPIIGDVHIDRINRDDLARLIRELTSKKLSPKTIANIHGLVASILKDAVTDRWIDRNPAMGLLKDVPDVKSEDMVMLTPAEFAMILSHVPDHYKPFTECLPGTGMRFGEITALQIRDIELFSRYPAAHVRRAWKNRDFYELGEPKTRRSRRSVTLSAHLIDLLIPIVIDPERSPDSFVFVNQHNRPIRNGDYHRLVWTPAVKAAQADGLTKRPRIHDCRHTFASWMVNDGIDIVSISRQLGHESIKTTIDRYSHLMPAHVDEINAAVDRALARNP